MKKIISTLVILSLLTFSGCGKDSKNQSDQSSTIASTSSGYSEDEMEEEIKWYLDNMNNCNTQLLPIPDECNEIPSDWEEFTFPNGVTFKGPSELREIGTSKVFVTFADAEEKDERNISVIKFGEIDWSENKSDEIDDDTAKVLSVLSDRLNVPYDYIAGDGAPAFEKLGYTINTRYELCTALLSITEKDLESTDNETANTIRYQRAMVYGFYGNEAYISEKENSHVFLHKYGQDKYLVSVMPSENYEYTFFVQNSDLKTALKIASTIDFEKAALSD